MTDIDHIADMSDASLNVELELVRNLVDPSQDGVEYANSVEAEHAKRQAAKVANSELRLVRVVTSGPFTGEILAEADASHLPGIVDSLEDAIVGALDVPHEVATEDDREKALDSIAEDGTRSVIEQEAFDAIRSLVEAVGPSIQTVPVVELVRYKLEEAGTYGVNGDVRLTDEDSTHAITTMVKAKLLASGFDMDRISFDSEYSCFFAYGDTAEDIDKIIDAVELTLAPRAVVEVKEEIR